MRWLIGVVPMILMSASVPAQSGGADIYSAFQLQQMAHHLAIGEAMRTTGAAGETLRTYTNDSTMLTMRTRSGGAEVHAGFSDIFFVLDGEAILTTGGKVLNAATAAPGETRGSGIEGGLQRHLAKGDVVHISPNTPHQLTIPAGKSFTYFVVKVRE